VTVARAARNWLELREPADARARSTELVDHLSGLLPQVRPLVIHDLGCGTGSMRRWLGSQLSGAQLWIEYDRDAELLQRDAMDSTSSFDGIELSVQTRRADLAQLVEADLTGASLVTASALLDMFTADELEHFVSICASTGCPCLITLSVIGRVDLFPHDSLDVAAQRAFNDHQRRTMPHGRLLGPDAAAAAADLFQQAGLSILTRPSNWRLGPADGPLLVDWFQGWLRAACEQDLTLRNVAGSYAQKRRTQLDDGLWHATVHHQDLLAWYP
jgi:trans-aconitate methyltransferase